MMIPIAVCRSAITSTAMARNCEVILVYNKFDVEYDQVKNSSKN
jgi:hypothetical protein